MTMYSRRDYRLIAKIIKDNTIINDSDMLPHSKINKITLISDLMNLFSRDNALFNGNKFMDACAVDSE